MLHTLRPATGSRKSAKRKGRGNSSGNGTTAGRGTKGYHSRSGSGKRHGFEGGQTPLIARQPKLGGFKNPRRKEYEAVNLSDLEAKLDAGKYDPADLKDRNVRSTTKPVKILGNGTLTKKLDLTVHAASKTAKEAIEKAGGSVTIASR